MAARTWDVVAAGLGFGVEIECTVPARHINNGDINRGSYRDGDSLGREFPDGWIGKYDGSIHTNGNRTDLEVVSPILHGRDGAEEMVRVVRTLYDVYNCRVNRSCGFHVHVGLDSVVDLQYTPWSETIELIRRLLLLVGFHEDGLLASTLPSRIGNSYCDSMRGPWAERLLYLDKRIQGRELIFNDIVNYASSRYSALNLTNVYSSSKTTLEFRLFPGTLNTQRLLGYVMLALGLVQKAANEARAPMHWRKRKESKRCQPCHTWSDELELLFMALGWRQDKRQYGWIVPYDVTIMNSLRRMARRMQVCVPYRGIN